MTGSASGHERRDGPGRPRRRGRPASRRSRSQAVTYDGRIRRALRRGEPRAADEQGLSPECPASLDDAVGRARELSRTAATCLAIAAADRRRATPTTGTRCTALTVATSSATAAHNVADMGVGKDGSIAAAERLQQMADDGLLKASVTGDIAIESFGGGDSACSSPARGTCPPPSRRRPDLMVCPVPWTALAVAGLHRRADVLHPDEGARTRSSRRRSSTTT